ncbi:MAG: hypothetical protein M1831_005500 [Alyxoria varia]|nr:MAG: hypothetical protein M1831_005500 [Alyxoria varia]
MGPASTSKTLCAENPPPSYEEATGSGPVVPQPHQDLAFCDAEALRYVTFWRSLKYTLSLFHPANRPAGSTTITDDDIWSFFPVQDNAESSATIKQEILADKVVNFRAMLSPESIKNKEVACFGCMTFHPTGTTKITRTSLSEWSDTPGAMLWTCPMCPTGQVTLVLKDPIITFWSAQLIAQSITPSGRRLLCSTDALEFWSENGWEYSKRLKVVQGRLLLDVTSRAPVGDLDTLIRDDGFHRNVQMCAHVKCSRSLASWFSNVVASLCRDKEVKRGPRTRPKFTALLSSYLGRCNQCPTEYTFQAYIKDDTPGYSSVLVYARALVDLGRCISVESREWRALTAKPVQTAESKPFDFRGLVSVEQRLLGDFGDPVRPVKCLT